VSTFITGVAGSGKTSALLERARACAQTSAVLATSSSLSSLAALRAGLQDTSATVRELHELALDVVPGTELIDDVRAAQLFVQAAQPLLDLEWVEFMEADLDPEIPGLHVPQRFLDAAFRLFCKLRDALISPETFLESALRGATQFYAKPPNFAGADLLHYTKDTYRDSLNASPQELQRQYRREIDLAKILSKLYRTYLDHPVRRGCLTPRDAVAEAVAALGANADAAAQLRARYSYAFIDDAQELTIGELTFLQSIYGESLEGVTLAGDRESAASAFRGARPDRVFAVPGERIVLEEQRRSPYAVDVAARHLLAAPGSPPVSSDERVGLQLFRATTQRAEAEFIADYVVDLLVNGASHDDIGILFRSVSAIETYRDALLRRNVRVQIAGDINVYLEAAALDALAVLWSLYDPFRHEYLLRTLQSAAFGLSDSSLQVLCGDPPDAQAMLFNETDVVPKETRSGRWDVKRDVRLALSVFRGDRDGDLPPDARERLVRLREARERWLDALRRLPLTAVVRMVWREGLARAGEPGSAQAAYQQLTLVRLLQRIEHFTATHEPASLGEFLEYAQSRMDGAFESSEYLETPGAVRMLSIDAARGREFDHVILPNVRAGSFPRWYVPDAFLYSPSLGMIAKENVGDSISSRTAKFTYYMWRTKAREAYNREERHAFVYALRRAKTSALVTASARATRGVAAPELLAELQAAHLPGVVDLSDRWRPARTLYTG
jgi:superfamily I DNA/RNA helicase